MSQFVLERFDFFQQSLLYVLWHGRSCFTLLAAFRASGWLKSAASNLAGYGPSSSLFEQGGSTPCADYTLPDFQRNLSKYLKFKHIPAPNGFIPLTKPLKCGTFNGAQVNRLATLLP